MNSANWPARLTIAAGGLIGLVIVAGLQGYFAVTAVTTPSLTEHILFATQALPFVYYLYRARRNWPERSTIVPDVLVHLVWLPAMFSMMSAGNFAITLLMLMIFALFTLISRQAQIHRAQISRKRNNAS